MWLIGVVTCLGSTLSVEVVEFSLVVVGVVSISELEQVEMMSFCWGVRRVTRSGWDRWCNLNGGGWQELFVVSRRKFDRQVAGCVCFEVPK